MEISKIEQALKQNRPETDIERDRNRKPADVLHFFGYSRGGKRSEK